MSISLYAIDGLGQPPAAWWMLGHSVRTALGLDKFWSFDRDNPQIIRQMRAEPAGTKIIAIGHSLGAFAICELSKQVPIHAAALIEIVRPNWLTPWGWFGRHKPVACHAVHKASWSKLDGLPPACEVIGGVNDVADEDHNSIIAKVSPRIVEWLRGVV